MSSESSSPGAARSRKTLEADYTDSEELKPAAETTTKTKKRQFKSITRDHIQQALTLYLRSISTINDNEEVSYFGVGDHFGTFHFTTENIHE